MSMCCHCAKNGVVFLFGPLGGATINAAHQNRFLMNPLRFGPNFELVP